MGSVVFQWQKVPQYQLLVVHNRDSFHNRVFKPACWWAENEETKDIFGGREETKGGTWFGCSKQGRVAFLVNVSPLSSDTSELLAVKFLKEKMTPREFAEELDKNKNLSSGCSFHLIVADIASKSMFHIFKKHDNKEDVEIDEVSHDFHSFYAICDPEIEYPKSIHLKNNLREIVAENKELTMKKIADELMSDESLYPSTSKPTKELKYGTTSTTAFGVSTTGKVSFYEKYLENGEWHEQDIEFDMVIYISLSNLIEA